MSWTTPADLRAQIQRGWERGDILAGMARGQPPFPRRLAIRGPDSRDIADHFDAVREWIRGLQEGEGRHYRLEYREVRHRLFGANPLPECAWVDSLEAAAAWIGKSRELRRFGDIQSLLAVRQPVLLDWLARKPLKALELADAWPRLLDIVAWLRAHPRPGIYPRQADIPGVHSKFMEQHRGVLSELFDLALPSTAIDPVQTGVVRFAARYGFLEKPQRIRLRWLDPANSGWPVAMAEDLTLRRDAFAALNPGVSRVFITENEINFLAFPPLLESLLLFGAGYGFEALADARWLLDLPVYYWGDIDTHGFAILDQLRAHLPHARSLLMDEATLLAHQPLWDTEPQPVTRDLPRLDAAEAALYDALRDHRLGRAVRLEQEAIGYGWARAALARAMDSSLQPRRTR